MIGEVTEGGAHVSIDALGSPGTAASSVRSLRRRGRHVQAGLLLSGPTPMPMDLVIARELEIYGSHGMAARDYPPMMAMVADGTLRPGLLIGAVIGLEGVGQALAAMDEFSVTAGITVVGRMTTQRRGREPGLRPTQSLDIAGDHSQAMHRAVAAMSASITGGVCAYCSATPGSGDREGDRENRSSNLPWTSLSQRSRAKAWSRSPRPRTLTIPR